MSSTFNRDGHTLALSFDVTGELAVRMVCPHERQDPPKYKDTPECRRQYMRDGAGVTYAVRPSCIVQANFHAEYYPMHFIHDATDYGKSFQIMQAPISVEWAMVDEDVITSLFLRPYYQTRDRHGARDFEQAFNTQVGKVPAEPRMRVRGEVRA